MNPAALVLTDRSYNILKSFVQIVLPALGSLYFGLSQIWGFPLGEEVVGTIAIVEVFLGALIGVSTRNYNQSKYAGMGYEMVDSETGETTLGIKMDSTADISDLMARDELTFKMSRE